MKLLKGDLIFGFIYGSVSFWIVGWWGILVATACACLWALGDWRRIFATLLIVTIYCSFARTPESQKALCSLSLFLQWGVIWLGSALERKFGPRTRPVWYFILFLAMLPMFMGATIILK